MKNKKAVKPEIAISVDTKDWAKYWPQAKQKVRAIMQHALQYFPMFEEKISLSVLLTDDKKIEDLNSKYRNKNKPTNVLSFPANAGFKRDSAEIFLGDIALALETTVREAQMKKIAIEAHAAHLLIHGLLHLLCYDHKKTAEAERMEALEALILTDYLNKS
jgi:probable rRNA maturation factor